MPLIVGIENGPDKGFTSREISLVNGFGFGILATQGVLVTLAIDTEPK